MAKKYRRIDMQLVRTLEAECEKSLRELSAAQLQIRKLNSIIVSLSLQIWQEQVGKKINGNKKGSR
jgi:hypothetical protein